MVEAEELAKATREMEISKQIYRVKLQVYGEALKSYDEAMREINTDE